MGSDKEFEDIMFILIKLVMYVLRLLNNRTNNKHFRIVKFLALRKSL